jgi:serine/threonine protein kinase
VSQTAAPAQPPAQIAPAIAQKFATPPAIGEVITSLATGNTYTFGARIGEGNFGVVYSCKDVWENDLAAKVLKGTAPYETVRASAEAELRNLRELRNPYITFVYDAFEFRDTFYIITERCNFSLENLFAVPNLDSTRWVMPVARCLLQAVRFLHLNGYAHQDIHAGNVFAAMVKDEFDPDGGKATIFKLGDLGVAKLVAEISPRNPLAQWMLPPEILNPAEFGAPDHRIDIYHLGLLLLQLCLSKEIRFSREDILAGRPRDMALQLPSPYSFALEKALRRHVQYRTSDAMELWRDLHTPALPPGAPPAAGGPDKKNGPEGRGGVTCTARG